MEVPIEQQQPQQVVDSTMTPEQQEEMKLRMKYPNPHKPGGSTFIQKMLHKGVSILEISCLKKKLSKKLNFNFLEQEVLRFGRL